MNIGVFDSGIGGLTVLKKITATLPQYSYVYYADNKNLPYGEKTPEELYVLTTAAIDILATKYNCRLIILACNTASTVLRRIQQEYLPTHHPTTKVLGVIRPAAEAIIECGVEPVGIMATQATVASKSFIHELSKLHSSVKVYLEACPRLVPLIEDGQRSGSAIESAIDRSVTNLKQKGVKTILLGCTHYEHVAGLIEQIAGMPIITEGNLTAQKLALYLTNHPEIEKDLSKEGTRQTIFTKQ